MEIIQMLRQKIDLAGEVSNSQYTFDCVQIVSSKFQFHGVMQMDILDENCLVLKLSHYKRKTLQSRVKMMKLAIVRKLSYTTSANLMDQLERTIMGKNHQMVHRVRPIKQHHRPFHRN